MIHPAEGGGEGGGGGSQGQLQGRTLQFFISEFFYAAHYSEEHLHSLQECLLRFFGKQ
jgi:hypothetical protein